MAKKTDQFISYLYLIQLIILKIIKKVAQKILFTVVSKALESQNSSVENFQSKM